MEKRLETAELWFLRQMFRISWTNHTINDDILLEADTRWKLPITIRWKQLQLLVHVIRKGGRFVCYWETEGKTDIWRQWLIHASVTSWSALDVIRSLKDKELWKSMIANVCRRQYT